VHDVCNVCTTCAPPVRREIMEREPRRVAAEVSLRRGARSMRREERGPRDRKTAPSQPVDANTCTSTRTSTCSHPGAHVCISALLTPPSNPLSPVLRHPWVATGYPCSTWLDTAAHRQPIADVNVDVDPEINTESTPTSTPTPTRRRRRTIQH
jgi:hypothetical protein